MGELPPAPAADALDPALSYLLLRVRGRQYNTEGPAEDSEALRRLGRDARLGPTTRARALSIAARAAREPAEQLALAEEALRLDPESGHVRLARAHALLSAGQVELGAAELTPAWRLWRAQHEDRQGSGGPAGALLNDSLRLLLRNAQVSAAGALLEDSRRGRSEPGGHEERVGIFERYRAQGGFTAAGDNAWLNQGGWRASP